MAPTIIRSVVTPTTGWYPGSGTGIYDLIDLGTVKSILGIADGTQDAVLQRFISQASTAIRKHCNRTFQIQTYQELLWSQRDPYPWQLPSGFEPLQLRERPIAGSPCIAGTAAPTTPGALSAFNGGALAAASYFVRITYQTPTGESPVSPETGLVVAVNSLLQVAPPPADPLGIATGWNVYVGVASGAETRQNGAPLALTAAWQMGATGPQPGAAMPGFVSVTLNANVNNSNINLVPQNLVEGQNFLVDYEHAQLTRLFNDGYPCHWEMLPIQVVYQAGFAANDPKIADLQDACIRLVRGAYFAARRDPAIRAQNIEGVYSAQFWFASGPGGGRFPPDIEEALADWRTPVMA